MKTLATLTIAGLLTLSATQAADVNDIRDAYAPGVFPDADATWTRNMSNRVSECGKFGKNRARRVDILVKRYNAVGEAISSGSEADIVTAAQKLSKTINSNSRFEKCWDRIARSKRVSAEFSSLMEDM
ncbi:MAG: hypothetical protein AAGD92_11735 [Pseudomonadota bacterium]